ncbi:uncharacterized protein BJ212DRAFT_1294958 [Suillus subaureus]|uniref:PH domain-containing protein n=1 Tax=Suillus subaureus TaxID=48587 RepID=A0A9P7ELM7_9AGAM|nr:uncharacterized protein BJ212DRAFT_1294958 [Suillus subaureus]KAG1825542.1 hypothetical protein BJ212DRAFT_1294958 [Suillus subaureus]
MNTSPVHNRKGSFLTQLFALRRKNQNTHVEPYIHDPVVDAPPPPPPKDHKRASTSTQRPFLGEEYINEKPLLFDVDLNVLARPPQPASQPIPVIQKIPPRIPAKAYSPPIIPLTPEEKARRRLAAQHQSELEKEAMLREEHERQETKRREKLEQERLEREEEEERKAVLQEELRAAALRKARLEREEREIEEQRLQELRERKQLEKERRLQYTKEMERWRAEQMQRAESQCSEKEEERRRSVEGRRMRVARMNEEVFSASTADRMVGWVTVQPPNMLAWKRRYYKFELGHAESKMLLYGNPREVVKPLDVLPLDGQIDSLAEWYEGFEELEAIPYSFALRFVDGVEWRMFADSAEEKDRLLVLLSEAAGIIL